MFDKNLEKIKIEVEEKISKFKEAIVKIRTSRISPSLVENIKVDCFGKDLPLKTLASISSPMPRELLLQPWDKIYLESIEKAIQRSGLGLTPILDKDKIRLMAPVLNAEYREDLLKLLGQEKELARENIRRLRESAWRGIQDSFQKKEISEDEKFKAKDKLQEIIDKANKKIQEISQAKEKEIVV